MDDIFDSVATYWINNRVTDFALDSWNCVPDSACLKYTFVWLPLITD